MLRGLVPPAITTKITQTTLSSSSSVVIFSSEVNTKFYNEQHKIEVEGIDQDGLKAQLQFLTGPQRVVQFKLLLSQMILKDRNYNPIILKISAN